MPSRPALYEVSVSKMGAAFVGDGRKHPRGELHLLAIFCSWTMTFSRSSIPAGRAMKALQALARNSPFSTTAGPLPRSFGPSPLTLPVKAWKGSELVFSDQPG